MPVGLVLVLVAVLLITIVSSYHQGNDKRKVKEYLKQENQTYIKPKSALNDIKFIDVNFNDINFNAKDDNAKEEINKLLAFKDLKIASFKGMTNNDLKKEYGTNNFDDVLEYQNNYEELLNQLRVTSEVLIKDEDEKSAMKLLNYAVDLGDDVTKSYTMLADLYAKNKLRKEMYHLVDTVRSNKNLSQQKIMSYISKLEKANSKGENK